MKIRRIFRLLLVVSLAMGLLAGCRHLERNLPDYRARPFRAEVRWSMGGVTMCAEVVTEFASENGRLAVSEILFSEPPSLAGIRVWKKDGVLSISRDGVEIPCEAANEWYSAVSVLCAEGELRGVCETELSGLSVQYAEIKDGETVYEVYRLSHTGEPKRIVCGENELTVIRFEAIEEETNENLDVDQCHGVRWRGNTYSDTLKRTCDQRA